MKIKARNAFNAMFVDTFDTGVCGSYTTPYTGVKTLHKVASCRCEEGRLFVFEKPSVFHIFLSDLSRTFQILDEPLVLMLYYWRQRANKKWIHACNEIVFTVYVDTVDTKKIPYSIHNSIALIFCIDCLDMSFNVHTTDKVTVSGFLTI